ncbi:MAG: FAD-binding protein, partial [Rubrobacteraceae bacterium]
MSKAPMPEQGRQEEALAALREIFGDRLKRGPEPEDHTLAAVSPRDAEEVERLAVVAGRLSLPLVALGAGTLDRGEGGKNGVLVRFDLMGATQLPDDDETWVEAEPGATLLSLENNLEARGLGLAVYPTSAPRATVGGWLAENGVGVGSFE